jgi:RNA polymerase-binding transcription factor DksA
MKDMKEHLQKMLAQVAECELIRDLATDKQKRELFDRLAQHHRELARQIELAIASRSKTQAPG